MERDGPHRVRPIHVMYLTNFPKHQPDLHPMRPQHSTTAHEPSLAERPVLSKPDHELPAADDTETEKEHQPPRRRELHKSSGSGEIRRHRFLQSGQNVRRQQSHPLVGVQEEGLPQLPVEHQKQKTRERSGGTSRNQSATAGESADRSATARRETRSRTKSSRRVDKQRVLRRETRRPGVGPAKAQVFGRDHP
jgi:hypothetical protein